MFTSAAFPGDAADALMAGFALAINETGRGQGRGFCCLC